MVNTKRFFTLLSPSVSLGLLIAMAAPAVASAQTILPDYQVSTSRVANPSPAGTMDMPVSALRFEPRVDVQGRNFAEAQADVAIRGGVFENTGVRIGAAALSDPQTGHYLVELPVAPQMLQAPRVLTGLSNASGGFNAGVGTVAFGWRAIENRGVASLSGGEHRYNRQSIYQGVQRSLNEKFRLGADIEFARSESDGSVPFGDHHFERAGARIQLSGANSQTDFFAGYQAKFFGWPNLYTPFGFNETENLQTVLLLLNHHWRSADGSEISAALTYRRNKDDYEFNRAVPGASNPFEHTTWLRGASVSGRKNLPSFVLNYSADFSADKIESTSLIFGPYTGRTIAKATLVPEWVVGHGTMRVGASYDYSNRNSSDVSPLAGISWRWDEHWSSYAEYSETTQLPTYTALKSNAAAGLFRGNANLGRSTSRNWELGTQGELSGWQLEAAIFHREDDQLVDWTYRSGVVARTANAVDTRTTGFEVVVTRRTERIDVVASYAWLRKQSDYGSALIDASFYALNFPTHRLTLAAVWRIGGGFELRSDNEYRVQEPNPLRTIGGRHALLSSVGLYYLPPHARTWEFSVLADNLWNSDFQEVPAVVASRRQWAAGVTKRW